MSREKGLEGMLDGYLDLLRRRDDVHLVITGDGPYREALESTYGQNVTFTGFLHGEALARLFAYCDIFVFPSATDTLGRAVAEAQASGLPAVVYDIGGPRECVRPDESGFAVPFGDQRRFFEQVEVLLDDADLRLKMGKSAHAFAETMSWETVVEDLRDIHSRVLDGSGPSAALPVSS